MTGRGSCFLKYKSFSLIWYVLIKVSENASKVENLVVSLPQITALNLVGFILFSPLSRRTFTLVFSSVAIHAFTSNFLKLFNYFSL